MTEQKAASKNNSDCKREVHFGTTVRRIVYDLSLTPEERDNCWHRPEDLKARTRQDVQSARRCFKSSHSSHHYCKSTDAVVTVRGLEKRLQSSEAQKRKWYSFLHSFLALQHDLRKLEGDVSNLLAVFVATHSKTHLVTALQVARQDQNIAHAIYKEEPYQQYQDVHMQQFLSERTNATTKLAASGAAADPLSKLNTSNHTSNNPSSNKSNLRKPTKKLGHARTA